MNAFDSRVAAVVLAAVAATGAAGQELPPLTVVDSVTLEEAVERTLRVAPQVVQARTSLGTASFGTKQAYAAMLPSLSVSTGASLSSSERYDPDTNLRVSGQSDSYSAGISSSMDLFAGGRNLAAVRSARATERAAEATLVTQRFAVALAAKQAFFAVLRAEELMELNRQRIAQAEEQLEAAERRLRVGSATRSDVLRARLELSNARQALLESATQRRTAMYALGEAIGTPGAVAARGPASLEPEPLAMSPAALRALMANEAPTVLSALADVRVAEAGVSQSRAQYFPTIGVSGGYNWSNQEFGLAQGLTSWSTRISLSYPLFNGLQREAAVDRANAQLTVAEARAQAAARAAVAELEALLAALTLAEQQLAILEESVEVAREDYRVQQERYEHGTATILELVSSQIALTQAEYDLINA
ncbi:MAG: TolC family protein, partial [Gemmatimonadetes bacterium]|nr:TolC family protein [Gemmatimonadota bacterium]NIQ52452.1 TolC family protein [Gemmatimonadota bacterium]NIU72585.1 TolC family protein [Gammaproteobacteria bacterium]NIX42996.1 TolC family protein [Gemmatimonadota bacterium]NIY07171.1 TolC family protein [Gemmatimonadota bacterium]